MMEHLILENGYISHDVVRDVCYFCCLTMKHEIFGTWGRQQVLVNCPGSSLRNQFMGFSTSSVMRPR